MNGQSAAKPLSFDKKYEESSTTISMKESRDVKYLETEGCLLNEWLLLPTISGVYLIKNIINHKVYVGISKNIRKKVKEHFYMLNGLKSKGGSKLKNAFNKYNLEDFRVLILEETTIDLVQKESNYIKMYNSVEQGYNIKEYDLDYKVTFKQSEQAIEKAKIVHEIPIMVFDINGKFIETLKSCVQVAKKYGYNRRTLNESICNNDKVILKNKLYFYRCGNHIFIKEKLYNNQNIISFKTKINKQLIKHKI